MNYVPFIEPISQTTNAQFNIAYLKLYFALLFEIMPLNICNSEFLAQKVAEWFRRQYNKLE
nr:hypothetical protein [Mycoplasmopsis bovis]